MRGGHNALSGVVRRLGLDPLDGHVYVFINRRRFIAALLWYDGSGWCVLKKRQGSGQGTVYVAGGAHRSRQLGPYLGLTRQRSTASLRRI